MAIIRNLTATDIELDDLSGITIEANSDYDLNLENTNDIANSLDLKNAIANGNIAYLDENLTPMTTEESINVTNSLSSVFNDIVVRVDNVPILNTPHKILNFIGGKAGITDNTDGRVDIDPFKGLNFNTISGNSVLCYYDNIRSKTLSVLEHTYSFYKESIKDKSYLEYNGVDDSKAGSITPYNATIVGITYLQLKGDSSTGYRFDLYVDGSEHTQGILNVDSGSEFNTVDNSLNIDISSGSKISIRARKTRGNKKYEDVSVVLYLKWHVI